MEELVAVLTMGFDNLTTLIVILIIVILFKQMSDGGVGMTRLRCRKCNTLNHVDLNKICENEVISNYGAFSFRVDCIECCRDIKVKIFVTKKDGQRDVV